MYSIILTPHYPLAQLLIRGPSLYNRTTPQLPRLQLTLVRLSRIRPYQTSILVLPIKLHQYMTSAVLKFLWQQQCCLVMLPTLHNLHSRRVLNDIILTTRESLSYVCLEYTLNTFSSSCGLICKRPSRYLMNAEHYIDYLSHIHILCSCYGRHRSLTVGRLGGYCLFCSFFFSLPNENNS